MRLPLRYQILLPFSAVTLLALAGVSILSAVLAASYSKRQTEAQLANIAATLRSAEFPLSEKVLQQMRGLSGAEFVLTGAGGQVLAHTVDWPDDFRASEPAPPSESFHLGPPVTIHGESFLYTAIGHRPTFASDDPLVVHVFYPESKWRETRWQAVAPPLAVGGATLALVAILAVVLTRRLTRPILQLREQVGRLARGDFEPVPLPARDDELRDLVSSVNRLALQLDDLEQAIKRAERLALLGQLSGGLAHHLRNTVTGALMAVQLHQRHCHVDAQSLDVALRQMALTEEHLQRFLAIGKPTAPRRTECDLRQIVAELATLLEPACRHRRVDYRVDAPDEPLMASVDADQIRQALINLVLNAIDAAGAGGWLRIELAALARGMARIRVVDSGAGPPPELRERLGEPFVTDKPEGVGLGLAVARQIATAHGGSLSFTHDQVTTFEIVLPAEPVPQPEIVAPAASLRSVAATVGEMNS